MHSRRTGQSVLQGAPPKSGHGAQAVLAVEGLSDPGEGSEEKAFEESSAEVFLAAPLLRVIGERGRRRVVIGQVRVTARKDTEPVVTLALQAAWSEADGWHEEPNPPLRVEDELVAALAEPAHPIDGDARRVVVTMAKAFAEASRNEVLRVRGLRYELERRIADQLVGRADGSLRSLLASTVELSSAVGRARDQALEAARSGLWIWLWDTTVYRRDRQPADGRPEEDLPAWASTHRAGVRHCEAMDRELTEEANRLHSLLGSMSTFAVAQGSEAQDRFTLIAGVGAAVLGFPALVLSLYGADAFLPLDTFDRAWRALLPIGATALAAATMAVRWMPGETRPRHYGITLAVVSALLAILLFAGALVPE